MLHSFCFSFVTENICLLWTAYKVDQTVVSASKVLIGNVISDDIIDCHSLFPAALFHILIIRYFFHDLILMYKEKGALKMNFVFSGNQPENGSARLSTQSKGFNHSKGLFVHTEPEFQQKFICFLTYQGVLLNDIKNVNKIL